MAGKNLLTLSPAIAISRLTVNADNDGRRYGASPGFPFSESFFERRTVKVLSSQQAERFGR